MTADERRKVEEALIRWRESQMDEWRQEYYFDCGELGIVRLFVCSYHYTRHWSCWWLDIEPCPVLESEQGEWRRAKPQVEYDV